MFHIDGTIEVRVSASGYLQGGFWEASQEGYGTAIQETTSSSFHTLPVHRRTDESNA
jgi:primary-amine oxidase